MKTNPDITNINLASVDKTGFFCYMSKRKEAGYQNKLQWVKARLAEGLRIKMILPPAGRGFIEYIPGEYAWRAVHAAGYMFIHCLWIVGRTRGQGHASVLLEECISDARRSNMHGVAMVTTEGTWLLQKGFLEKHGFVSIAQAPPAFDLMVLPFDNAPKPAFAGDWDAKLQACGTGLTLSYTDQCPYIANMVKYFQQVATEMGVPARAVKLNSAAAVRRFSPSPYGVFNAVLNGKLLSYHFLKKEELSEKLSSLQK